MISTKLSPPALTTILERTRLLEKLLAWDGRKVVIIHGPAGQGKSSLAADYARSLAAPSVWYTLDQGDDDPAAFLACFVQAVKQAFPRHVADVPAAPRDRHRGAGPSPATAHWLAGILRFIPSGLFIFDDYHVLAGSTTVPALLAMIIEASPPAVRFMVLSRTKPELPLGNLRLTGAPGELSGSELRFTDTEVNELFGAVFGSPLSKSQSAHICRLTEGWAAGLVLMHRYLAESGPSAANALPDRLLSGFREQVFEYLAQEVFSRLDPGLRQFLLRTSITECLPLRLAAALSGLPADAAEGKPSVTDMLAQLAKCGLFADRGGGENVLRRHALFREFLVKELIARTHPAEVRGLYRTAARFFIGQGDPVRAIELFIASGRHEQAVRLLERSVRGLIASGRIRTALRMIDGFPPDLRERPWFLLTRAVACRFADPQTTLTLSGRAFAGFQSEGNAAGQMLALGCVIEAAFHSGGDFKRMGRAAAQAQALLRKRGRDTREARAALLLALGTAWFFTGSLPEGIDALRRAMDLFRSLGDSFSQITCAIYLTPCALYHGDFRLAREAVRRGFAAQRAAPDDSGGEAALHLVRAMACLFEGDFVSAQDSLDACRRLSEERKLESLELLMMNFSGWLKIAQGDYRGADALLEECKRRGEISDKGFFLLSSAHFLSLSCLFQRKLDRALLLADHALAGEGRSQSRLFGSIYRIVRGSIRRELGDGAGAEDDLRAALRALRKLGALQQEANAHLSLAGLYLRQDRLKEAVAHLRSGFMIGRDRGFTYYALLTPQELRELAREAVAAGICAEYCTALLDPPERSPAHADLRICCLGGFRLYKNGEHLRERDWKGKRAKQLVKLLVSRSGKPLSRDLVVEVLWPGCDPGRQSSMIGNLLHRVRKTLDRGGAAGTVRSCLRHENEHLSFDRSTVWTDVDAFNAAISEAARADNGKDGEKTLRLYDQGLSLYQGDFLPEDGYEEWTQPLRDELRAKYLKALDRAGGLADELGAVQQAAAYYERLFAVDQCAEKACRWLMTRALAEGRRSEAIRAYERCQLALQKELDIEPEEKTRRLYRSIIGG